MLAASFAAAAVAAGLASALRRLLGGATRISCAALSVFGAAGLAAFAGPDVLALAAVAFAAFYVGHGATWPLLSAVLHGRVTAAHRATAVSAMSLLWPSAACSATWSCQRWCGWPAATGASSR